MILALSFLCGLIILGVSVGRALAHRSSAATPLVAFPLIAALLGAPIVLEDGCYDSTVVTGTPESGLEAHHIAWCPDRCVNVPNQFTQALVLPNGFVYEVQLTVEPIAATRLVWEELPRRENGTVPWASEVENILRKRVEPVFAAYLQANEIVVLRRNSNNTNDLSATAGELLRALHAQGLPFTAVRVLTPARR